MALLIPVNTEFPDFTEVVSVDTTVLKFRFRWNVRESSWYLSVFTASDVPIFQGVKLVVDYDPFAQYVDDRMPTGKFILYDSSGQGLPATRDDLGSRVQLIYFTEDELTV